MDMPAFDLLSFIFISIGYQIFLISFTFPGDIFVFSSATQAMLIIGFYCYVATFFTLTVIKFGTWNEKKGAKIFACVLAFLAGRYIVSHEF